MKYQLQDKAQRKVLRDIGQGKTGMVSVYRHVSKEWRRAADRLVEMGLAKRRIIGTQSGYSISDEGRALLSAEVRGAHKQVRGQHEDLENNRASQSVDQSGGD